MRVLACTLELELKYPFSSLALRWADKVISIIPSLVCCGASLQWYSPKLPRGRSVLRGRQACVVTGDRGDATERQCIYCEVVDNIVD